MTDDDTPTTLRTTARSIEILQYLEDADGARVSELAEWMDAPKSTVHGHLATLEAENFLFKQGDVYHLGPELLRLGNQVRTREEGFALAREFTERLFRELELRSIFTAEMGGKAVFIHTASGNKMGWTHERLGNRLYMHNTAVGKAILAELPRYRVEAIIDEWGLPAETPNTITDRDELYRELDRVREQGYAVNHAENFRELHAIGVAATKQSGDVIGAFSATGPEHSLTGDEREADLADTISEIVNEYELELALA